MKKKDNMTATIASLTTGRRSDKRYIGTLERNAAKCDQDTLRLEAELEASRRECGQLKKEETRTGLMLSDLRLQIYHFQKLVYYTAQVTTWQENGDGG